MIDVKVFASYHINMKRFTKEDFIKHLSNIAPDWELLGDYTNSLTRTEFRHKVCGRKTLKTPCVVTSKPNSCRFCNAKSLSASAAFAKHMSEKKDYELLSEYVNSRLKVRILHTICGNEFETAAGSFVRSKEGCPYCKSKTISKSLTMTHERFLETVGERALEYEFLTEYSGAHNPIMIRHSCGNTFSITPDSFLRGGRCKICKYSTGEGDLIRALSKICPYEIKQGDRSILPNRSEIDLYIPEINLGIEYDGLAYHTVEHFTGDTKRGWTKHKAINRHLWKTRECEKKEIRLIHVFEDEWLEHKDIVLDKISAVMKLPCEQIFARKLSIKPISQKEASVFLDANHIQGRCNATISVGLFNDDELVAVQSFSPYTRRKISGAWELVRYATKLGTRVVGGFSRCLKWFEREYRPKMLFSFADKRWCDFKTNVYEVNGFVRDGDTPPSYWWVKPPKRWHKSIMRKSRIKSKFPEIYSSDKTELQMANEAGFKRIYDCGLIRYMKTY